MEIEIEYRGLKLRCEVEHQYQTFEQEVLGVDGNFTIESIKLQDSEVDIFDLVFENISSINELIAEKL
jgi:hypothetical protein